MNKIERANAYADMMIREKKSAREVAQAFGVSKSTVLKYVRTYTTGFFRKIRLKARLKKNLEAHFPHSK